MNIFQNYIRFLKKKHFKKNTAKFVQNLLSEKLQAKEYMTFSLKPDLMMVPFPAFSV